MLIAVYGKDLSREVWAEQFQNPLVVACGRQKGRLEHPGVHDLGILGALLKRAHGIPWAMTVTRLREAPAHDFREGEVEGKSGTRLFGTPLSEEEQVEIGRGIQTVGSWLNEQKRNHTLPLTVVIHSYDRYYEQLHVKFNDVRIVNTKAREALSLICEMQTTVLTVGERKRWSNGIVIDYEADIPDGIRDMVDIVIEASWEGDAIKTIVRDKRDTSIHIGEELTMAEMKVLLGYPIVAKALMEEALA